MTLAKFIEANKSNAVLFSTLPNGAQYVGLQGGTICTKIAAGKSAFANDHSGKVFVTRENWNRKVIMITGTQAVSFKAI